MVGKFILKSLYIICLPLSCLLMSCEVENIEKDKDVPKSDFSSFNYVLATEDAANEDITTFFAFNLSQVNPEKSYDLLAQNDQFINANPSVSSGHYSLNNYFFTLAKDKKGYSSTPGLYRMALNKQNRVYINDNLSISKNSLFPARQLCIVNEQIGYFYDEGKEAYKIKIFNPSTMYLQGTIDLKPLITAFRPGVKWVDESGNNLVRTGSLVLDYKEGKLYVSVVFLEKAAFNLIAENEQHFYLAVIDVFTQKAEKIISFNGIKTVGFFVSENKASSVDQNTMYLCSWGWNQLNTGNPSKIIRIKPGETEFDTTWSINIEKLFGVNKIAQSMIAWNGKIYLHISDDPYDFNHSDELTFKVRMSYYEFDPNKPEQPIKLEIPGSNSSTRMNVFSVVNDKLFIAVPNREPGKFNGYYSLDKTGLLKKELTLENKYRPTRLYWLHD